ncbi:MAG TPA: DUF2007 domain-containing protein [Bryobacteraceae bacterium]|nr:DUF2007 domain-containing protein [Bryobacteraceae bacterium]
MTDERMTVVRSYLNKIEAELAKGLLASEDIDSIVQADDAGGTRPNLWMSGIRLLVRSEDAARAERILAELVESGT